jgi:gluconolactonase
MGDGTVCKVGAFVYMNGGARRDGMAMNVEDNLAVAHAGLGGAWLYSKQGLTLAFIRSCKGDFTTNIAFGGVDNKSFYMTESSGGCILKGQLPFAGRAVYSHAA